MENNSQAIEIKGIVRNQTKIGVQDGQCDDIVNLRFKDGSWRVADDGKSVYNMTGGYSQLFVHTNVYHHLLGVKDGKLYWFANIESDGETFVNLDAPVEICDVQGDVTIVQNGHLLTIISETKSSIDYSIYRSGTNEYKELKVNPNGDKTDRGLYPFGMVHLNLIKRDDAYVEYTDTAIDCTDGTTDGAFYPTENKINAEFTLEYCKDKTKKVFGEQTDKNVFTRPFLAIVAVKLYDGSHIYASAPILLNPNERANKMLSMSGYKSIGYKYEDGSPRFDGHPSFESLKSTISQSTDNPYVCVPVTKSGSGGKEYEYSVFVGGGTKNTDYNTFLCDVYKAIDEPIYSAGAHFKDNQILSVRQLFRLLGYNMAISLTDSDYMLDNEDIFASLCIFVTPQVDIFQLDEAGELSYKWISAFDYYEYYKPKERSVEDITYDLTHSPFYLLREYSINELRSMNNTSTEVDLSSPEYKGLLSNIVHSPILDSEAFNRKDFFPQTAYQYNARLHLANYKSNQFKGYPIDFFQFNNHSVKIDYGSYAVGGVLPNLKDGADSQYVRGKIYFIDANDQETETYIYLSKFISSYFAFVKVTIKTQQGDTEVVRYIAPYNAHVFQNGDYANFVEELSPLLTYPDARATEMEIRVAYLRDQTVEWIGGIFHLSPHQYLNIAYYINPTLKPISFHDDFIGFGSCGLNEFDDYGVNEGFIRPLESNNIESFPNGLKVSKTNNPFFFPNETTYQIGSSEIIALMSNAVAIGIGQTGTAPLYVFCKDGISALLVDSSGEMAYSNARIIARDVCNNEKSVTPIDSGVVFTTDRGLMSIAGSEVVEIGSAAEGDVFDITDTSDKAKKIMFNAFTMPQLAEFPQSIIDNTDFITYLKGAIVNYNHNERELMVSNPSKDYTYVMDRNGNWSRRAFTAQEYVNNYPTSYRIDKEGKFYKVDTDDDDTNQVYLLSNIIKLGTIAFKQAYRLVVRGYFDVSPMKEQQVLDQYKHKVDTSKISDKNFKYQHTICWFTVKSAGTYNIKFENFKAQEFFGIVDEVNGEEDVDYEITILDNKDNIIPARQSNDNDGNLILSVDITSPKGEFIVLFEGKFLNILDSNFLEALILCDSVSIAALQEQLVGLYVFGSYDGRQWSLLGGNEKSGKFADIGCKIAHTDIRYLRVCLAGKLSKDTRIDYIEVSADGSALNGKLR